MTGLKGERPRRIAEIVGAVARQAMAERGVARIALLDDGSPEARLSAEWLEAAIPAGSLIRVAEPPPELESLLRSAGDGARARIEALRLAARMLDDAIVANPVNRTAMLLSGDPPPDPLLPLADLFASQVSELAGGWSAPRRVMELAELAGGVAALDRAVGLLLDGRDRAALNELPEPAREPVRAALLRGRAGRRSAWVVPKMAYRTLGVDLFQ